MNWLAAVTLISAIRDAIDSLEKQLKQTSELIKSTKLEISAVEYFDGQTIEQKEAIRQLKDILSALDTTRWDILKSK